MSNNNPCSSLYYNLFFNLMDPVLDLNCPTQPCNRIKRSSYYVKVVPIVCFGTIPVLAPGCVQEFPNITQLSLSFTVSAN